MLTHGVVCLLNAYDNLWYDVCSAGCAQRLCLISVTLQGHELFGRCRLVTVPGRVVVSLVAFVSLHIFISLLLFCWFGGFALLLRWSWWITEIGCVTIAGNCLGQRLMCTLEVSFSLLRECRAIIKIGFYCVGDARSFLAKPHCWELGRCIRLGVKLLSAAHKHGVDVRVTLLCWAEVSLIAACSVSRRRYFPPRLAQNILPASLSWRSLSIRTSLRHYMGCSFLF